MTTNAQQPSAQYYATPVPQQPDRSGLLITAGIFEILLAIGFLGLFGLTLLALLINPKSQTSQVSISSTLIKVCIMYAATAAFFLVMAIGTFQAKRWVRALMNAICWLWLVLGITISFVCAAIFPRTFARMGNMPPGAVLITVVLLCFFVAFFLIVVPGLLLLIYRNEGVKMTCERKDPNPSWTDRLATGPLILFLIMLLATVMDFWMALSRPMFPFFGKYLTHWTGTLAFLITGIWRTFLAWDSFFLRLRAWFLILSTYILVSLSTAITLWRADVSVAYRQAGFSAAEIASASSLIKNPAYIAVLVGLMFATVIFVASLRKYYTVQSSAEHLSI